MKKISRKGFLKVAAAAAMSGVTASALAACNAGSSSSTAASTGEAIYTPGTYTGTATGIGEVKVTMTFSETAITDVVIDASNETESIGGVAAPTLKDALMAAQSTEIDNISGATITTNAVKKAAASCIEQAMGVHTAGGDTAASSSDEDWLGTEPEIDESKVAKTVDVDVAVVGCGVAGAAAASPRTAVWWLLSRRPTAPSAAAASTPLSTAWCRPSGAATPGPVSRSTTSSTPTWWRALTAASAAS
jgi:uncharacterized protein with FMN-binding domain